MKREEVYHWMDRQIEAAEIQNIPVSNANPYYIRIAGNIPQEIHIYGIDNLCKELNIHWNVENHSNEFERHYFMYRGYKFFGLVEKDVN